MCTENVDYLLLTDDDADVPTTLIASNYSYPPGAAEAHHHRGGGGHHPDVSLVPARSPFVHRPLLVFVDGRPSSLRCIAVGGNPVPHLQIDVVPPNSRPGSDRRGRTSWRVDGEDEVGQRPHASSLRMSVAGQTSSSSSSPAMMSPDVGRLHWFSSDNDG